MELFEDDPIEYIRRDLEGSDSDTRRRAVSDFVRSLSIQFDEVLTGMVGQYITHYLDVSSLRRRSILLPSSQKYSKNRADNWKDKDVAIYLLMAITAKTATAQVRPC